MTMQHALKKIPIALGNLGIKDKNQSAMLQNYIINLLILCISDTDFTKRLEKDLPKVIKEICEL